MFSAERMNGFTWERLYSNILLLKPGINTPMGDFKKGRVESLS